MPRISPVERDCREPSQARQLLRQPVRKVIHRATRHNKLAISLMIIRKQVDQSKESPFPCSNAATFRCSHPSFCLQGTIQLGPDMMTGLKCGCKCITKPSTCSVEQATKYSSWPSFVRSINPSRNSSTNCQVSSCKELH